MQRAVKHTFEEELNNAEGDADAHTSAINPACDANPDASGAMHRKLLNSFGTPQKVGSVNLKNIHEKCLCEWYNIVSISCKYL